MFSTSIPLSFNIVWEIFCCVDVLTFKIITFVNLYFINCAFVDGLT